MQYGVKDSEDMPLTDAILKRAFNLSSSIVIGQFNAIEVGWVVGNTPGMWPWMPSSFPLRARSTHA